MIGHRIEISGLWTHFYQVVQGMRITVSESARREILSRLLRLNHERWEEEMKNAEDGMMNEKKGKSKRAKKSKSAEDGQMGLL